MKIYQTLIFYGASENRTQTTTTTTITNKHMEIFLDQLATMVLQNEGLTFTSEREVRHHLDRIKGNIQQGMQHGNQMLKEGLQILTEFGEGFVASFSAKFLKHIKSSKKIARLLNEEIIQNSEAMPLFLSGVEPFMESDNFHREQCVLAVLLTLFPDFPQPYVFLANLLWREHGIEAADTFYSKLIDAVEDPALDYFAADCFYKNGKTEQAKQLLTRALNHPFLASDTYLEIKKWALRLRSQC